MNAAQTMLDWALQYAEHGWAVFPISRTKVPATANGLHDATHDPVQIREWWAKRPGNSIGVRTGAISGIVVLDHDAYKAGGIESWAALVERYGQPPPTVVATSGRGGKHYYFTHPGGYVSNAEGLQGLPFIDVRGDGGYIIVPPSLTREGVGYTWDEGFDPFSRPLAPMPTYIGDRVPGDRGAFPFDEAFPEGERNASLTRVGGLLRTVGWGQERIFKILLEENTTRCIPPLEEREVEAIAKSVSNYAPYNTRLLQDMPVLPPPPENNPPPHPLPPPAAAPVRNGATTLLQQEILMTPHTDAGFAHILALLLTGEVGYDHARGKWYLFDEVTWVLDPCERIVQMALGVVRTYRDLARRMQDEDERLRALKFADSLEGHARLQAGLAIARSQPDLAFGQNHWDLNPDLLGLPNGVLNLETGAFRTGTPEDCISLRVGIPYAPDAQAPLFTKFLKEIFAGNEEVIHFLQTVIGYALTGHNREQCFFLFVGNGSNGKSVLLKTLQTLLGDYAMTTPFSTFERGAMNSTNTNDLAAMMGKRMVVASETTEGALLNEARLKSLTGGELTSARFLHQEYFEFTPVVKIFLSVNHPPRVSDDTEGFWRRMRRFDFPVQFLGDQVDAKLDQKLAAELPGVLNWALAGARAWYQEGLRVPATVALSTQTYRKDSDPLDGFLHESCELGASFWASEDKLYRAYRTYCETQMLKAYEIFPSGRFQGRLRRTFDRQAEGPEMGYLGIRLKESAKVAASGGFTLTRVQGGKPPQKKDGAAS